MARGAIRFSVKGGKDLEAKLREFGDPKKMRSAARGALRKAAAPMVADAQAGAPEDEGDLKRSIKQAAGKTRTRRNPDLVKQVVGIDRNEQPPQDVARKEGEGTYRDPGVQGVGPIIEFGKVGEAPRPFFRPAFDNNREKAVTIITDELGKALDRRAKALAKKAAKA